MSQKKRPTLPQIPPNWLKSLKIEYVVALGISLDILVQQMREKKSYGFTAI